MPLDWHGTLQFTRASLAHGELSVACVQHGIRTHTRAVDRPRLQPIVQGYASVTIIDISYRCARRPVSISKWRLFSIRHAGNFIDNYGYRDIDNRSM